MDLPKEPPLSFNSFNIKTVPNKVRLTICGKIRSFSTITVLEWIFLSISLLGLATSFGLSMQRILERDTLNTSDFTFGILLLVTIVFCAYYVIHSVLTERGDELMIFVISTVIVLIYCIANYFSKAEATQRSTIKFVRLIIVCVLSPFLIGVGTAQSVKYCRSNNLIFNIVGGLTDLHEACKLFNLCTSLLKFDFQLQLSMLVLVMGMEGNAIKMREQVILGSGIIITVIFVVIGFLGLRKENSSLMIVFYVLGLLEPSYIAYKFYFAITHENVKGGEAIYGSTFACGCFAFAVWICLMAATAYFSTHHFGKGLKEKMFGEADTSRTSPSIVAESSDHE